MTVRANKPALNLREEIAKAQSNNAEEARIGSLVSDSIDAVAIDAETAVLPSITGNVDVAGTVTADGLTVDGNIQLNGDLTVSDATTDPFIRLDTNEREVVFRIDNDASDRFDIRDNLSAANRLSIADNGDISFYEDTGVTAKFFWDSSAEALAVGSSSISAFSDSSKLEVSGKLRVYNSASSSFGAKLSHDGTNAILESYRETVGATPLVLNPLGGNVGIGTSTPSARFDVRIGSTSGTIAEFHNDTGYGIDIGSSISEAFVSSGFNQAFLFKTDSGGGQTERMRLDSSGHLIVPNGVTLGTAVGTYNAANTLDDYESGTWTPAFNLSTTDFDSVTYNTGVTGGTYVKVGNLVHVQGSIYTTSITVGAGTGDLNISGLPFTIYEDGSTQSGQAAGSIGDVASWAGDYPSVIRGDKNTTRAYLYSRGAANGATSLMNAADLSTTSNQNLIRFSITYRTA